MTSFQRTLAVQTKQHVKIGCFKR